ncbi:hypothetical protein [Brumimicrobium oceani]|uniref:Uncharacterized protein n=1 Tax=Brumimicrobium oceani TaxID=2100725 RepID=A0A2U2XE55_9FLAO|nr:hypothetical protein [Brumimicrobium oceani]PWH86088.1 hypothetical protein DIT68_05900 [Brumimicrobium oceani]
MEIKKKSVVELLEERSILKQDVYATTLACYKKFKSVVEEELAEFRLKITDERVRLKFDYNGDFETHAYVGSDVLVFNMHTNVFTFPPDNPIWKNSYIEEDNKLGYFGVINIYNFLAESFLQKRMNDAGYLIGRIFINKDGHFMIEGKGELSYYFKNIRTNTFDLATMKSIFEVAVKHAAEFDLQTPPYNKVSIVSVQQIKTLSSAQELKTGKRLGFKFKAENEKKY